MGSDPGKCEPCSYFGMDTPAATLVGWDETPACWWHKDHSWSTPIRWITREVADSWVREGYVKGYTLPEGISEEEATRMLTLMFNVAEPVEEPEPAPPKCGTCGKLAVRTWMQVHEPGCAEGVVKPIFDWDDEDYDDEEL